MAITYSSVVSLSQKLSGFADSLNESERAAYDHMMAAFEKLQADNPAHDRSALENKLKALQQGKGDVQLAFTTIPCVIVTTIIITTIPGDTPIKPPPTPKPPKPTPTPKPPKPPTKPK